MRRFKMTYRKADVLDWICTVIAIGLAFWADWRIGLAFLAYDLSLVFKDIKADMKLDVAADMVLKKLREKGEDKNVG